MKKLLFTLMSVAALLGWSTVSAQGTYSKITSADDLVEDGVYLIATAEYGMALGMNFGNNAARENVAVTITNGVISTEVATQPTDKLPYEIVLKKNGDNWALYDLVNQKYIARTTTDENKIQNQDEPYEWTITIDADGNVDIASLESTVRRILYNSNTGQLRFSAYKAVNNTNKVVQLYKKGGVYVDEKAPEIKNISTTNATTVEVLFNEALDATSAETVANYTVNNGITVSAAQLGDDNKTVTLTTSALTAGINYELTVNGVKDVAGNATQNLKVTFAFGAVEVENIAALVAMRDTYMTGQKYRVKGEVVVTALIGKFGSQQTTTNAWVQDKGCEKSMGHSMMLYYVNDLLKDAKVGDVLSGLTGELTIFNDLIEMQNFDASTIEINGTADITVDDVTIAELKGTDKWLYQNAIVRVKGVEFADAGETFEENVPYNISDGANTIAIYTNREGSYLGTKIPLTECDVTAYVGYNSGNVQLGLRTKDDIAAASVAVENNEAIRFSVYPNPTEGLLNVELAEGGQFSLFVYNTNGMQMMRREGLVDNTRVDLSGLAHGMYIVEIRTAEGVVRTKVVVR